jgi:hypothetical protein
MKPQVASARTGRSRADAAGGVEHLDRLLDGDRVVAGAEHDVQDRERLIAQQFAQFARQVVEVDVELRVVQDRLPDDAAAARIRLAYWMTTGSRPKPCAPASTMTGAPVDRLQLPVSA